MNKLSKKQLFTRVLISLPFFPITIPLALFEKVGEWSGDWLYKVTRFRAGLFSKLKT